MFSVRRSSDLFEVVNRVFATNRIRELPRLPLRIVLGCMTMGFLDVARSLQERLHVPVVNPVLAGLKAAEVFSGILMVSPVAGFTTSPDGGSSTGPIV